MLRNALCAAIAATLTTLSPATTPSEARAASGFVCPWPLPANAAKGAPTLTTEYFSGATDITADKRLPILVNDLRKAGMSPSDIIDHLLGAYCPLVAANSALADWQKTLMVRRFARQVAGLVFVPPLKDELAILVDVPMPTELFDEINAAATKAGVSRDEWIERAVKRALTPQ